MTTTSTIDLQIERPPAPPVSATDWPTAAPPIDAPSIAPLKAPSAPPTQLRTRARRYVQALVEVVDGDRPAIQLLRMSTDAVYDDLVDRLDSLAGLSARGTSVGPLSTRVASVHVKQPDADVAEVSARTVQGGRSRALALRLEQRDGRWLCSAIRWG